MCTIISNKEILNSRLSELKSYLTNQKYPSELIENGIKRALAINQEELRKTITRQDEKVLPYVSTHNPKNLEFFNIIKENLPVLYEDANMKDIFSQAKIIKSKRQPANLKRLLTRAKYTDSPRNNKIIKCENKRCGLCKFLIEGDTFHFKNGRQFKIKFSGNCEILNVIYAMKCAGCGEDYIGETANLRNRVTLHNQHIRNPHTALLPVSRTHCKLCKR